MNLKLISSLFWTTLSQSFAKLLNFADGGSVASAINKFFGDSSEFSEPNKVLNGRDFKTTEKKNHETYKRGEGEQSCDKGLFTYYVITYPGGGGKRKDDDFSQK